MSGELIVTSPLPQFMQEAQVWGIEDLGRYIVLPRVKVVQRQSSSEILRDHDPGDVIVVPQTFLIASVEMDGDGRPLNHGEPFRFVPLFFYAEWCTWNPYELKGSLPAIRERSLDPASALAEKARTPSKRFEPCPESASGKQCQNVEHLNFVISLVGDNPLAGTPLVISFCRAEHYAGSTFAALIKMRKAPLFGCQFEAATRHRTNAKGNWFGIDVSNPAKESGVAFFVEDQETFERYRSLHDELKQAHRDMAICVDYESHPETADTVAEQAGS